MKRFFLRAKTRSLGLYFFLLNIHCDGSVGNAKALFSDRSEIKFNRSTLAFILYLTTGQIQFEFASEMHTHVCTSGIRDNDKDVNFALLVCITHFYGKWV